MAYKKLFVCLFACLVLFIYLNVNINVLEIIYVCMFIDDGRRVFCLIN